jgi:branched-chain amino acid aminotransferase
MSHVNFNGECYKDSEVPINHQNRAFKYGDGLFETIRIINGKPVFVKNHVQRIKEGLKILHIDAPEILINEKLENSIVTLAQKNGIEKGGSARLTIWRDSSGKFKPTSDNSAYLLEIEPFPENIFMLNKSGLSIDIFQDVKKQVNKLSKFKHLNSQINVLASIHARENELDDSLLINEEGMIIESTNSNIFIVRNGTLYTPPLSDGCVGGTMRMHLINAALELNIGTYESSLNQQHLLMSDEILLTNAIRGVQWINAFKHKRYFSNLAEVLVEKINELAMMPFNSDSDQTEN